MLKKSKIQHTFIPMGASVPPELFQNKIVSDWLSSSEAAQYLKVSENALRIMVCRRQVPFHKLGRRLRFKLRELENLIAPIGG